MTISGQIRALVIKKVIEEGQAQAVVAVQLGIGERSVQRIMADHRATGGGARATGPRKRRKDAIPDGEVAMLAELARLTVSPTLPALAKLLQAASGAQEAWSTSTIDRALKRAKISVKQITYVDKWKDYSEKVNFCELIARLDVRWLVFLDETGKDRRATLPRRGRAPVGEAAVMRLDGTLQQRKRGLSIFGAMNIDGIIGAASILDNMGTAELMPMLQTQLLPHLGRFPGPNSVVVMDSWSVHHTEEVVTAIESTGALVLYLPAYTPELNPIELVWGVADRKLRSSGRDLNEVGDIEADVLALVRSVTPEEAKGMYRSCGYITSAYVG